MPKRVISQKQWVKGLVATTSDQAQPKGSLPRITNLIYNRRGGLKTCDGSLAISALNGIIVPGSASPWTDIFLFQPVNVARYYIGIQKDQLLGQILAPTPGVADGGAGGTLAAGNYVYAVSALDGAGGETLATSATVFANAGAHKAAVTWAAIPNAQSYNVYRTAAGGSTKGRVTNVTTNSFTDDGSLAPNFSINPPSGNTTQTTILVKIPAGTYTDPGNVLARFPADAFRGVDGTPGGFGGGGGIGPVGSLSGPTAGDPPTPQGGLTGNVSALPQIVQFVNKAFIALGNGFAPQILTDPSTVAAVTNTFNSTYPDWQTATVYGLGDMIKPGTNNAGGFVFKAVQGGTSAGANPTFPQTMNQTVSDNKIIWQNIGIGAAAPAPRGAAHAIVYAGSLWLLNTAPATTTDLLDGPNCLKMSDLNNPTSWNPLNVAFLSKDDGDQGTGLATFTVSDTGIISTQTLFAFKNFKAFQITGVFGSSNFAIQEAKTDMGCIAPRSIQFLPGFGVARLTHLGVAIIDTTNDRLISEDIRPYLFGGVSDIVPIDWNFAYLSKGSQTANPPMYVLAIPIALNNLPINGSGSGSAPAITISANGTGGTFTPGTYYFRVTRFTTLSDNSIVETEISQEVAIATAAGANPSFTVRTTSTQIDKGATKYRWYGGILPGLPQYYREITPAQMAAGVTITTIPNLGTIGSINTGTGGLTRILCYDLVFKVWTIIDLPFSISVLKQVRAPGTQPITITGGYHDGSVRRLQAGDSTFDGSDVAWKLTTTKVFAEGGNRKVFYRGLAVRGKGSPKSLSFIPKYNRTVGQAAVPVSYALGDSGFQITLDLFVTALDADMIITGSGPTEIDSIDWTIEPLPEQTPLIMG